MNAVMIGPKVQRWLRFVVGGGINTGFTYLVYLGMNFFLSYQVSYFIAYATGIIFSYWFNARIVFRVPLSWTGLFSYPIAYVVQYLVSAFFLGRLVEFFRINELIAPLIATIALIPMSYLISKFLLERKAENTTPRKEARHHEQ